MWSQLPLNLSLNSTVSVAKDSSISLDNDTGDDILDILKPFTNNLVIGSLNINSLAGKFGEILEWIPEWIDRTFPDSQFAIKGFDVYHRDRKKGGGGYTVH